MIFGSEFGFCYVTIIFGHLQLYFLLHIQGAGGMLLDVGKVGKRRNKEKIFE